MPRTQRTDTGGLYALQTGTHRCAVHRRYVGGPVHTLIPFDLQQLTADQGPARVSIFLPTVDGADGMAENRTRLEVLLRLVDDRLRADGLVDEACAVVSAVRRAVDEWWRWRNPSDGLVVFADPGHVRYFRVRLPLPELAAVGRRFLVGPLLPLLAPQQHLFVLSIDPDDLRLFTATRFRLDEVDLDSAFLPELAARRRERTQAHSSGDLGGTRAGDPAQQALYRHVNSYPSLLAAGVPGSPRDFPLHLVHSWACDIAEPELRADERAAAGRYRELLGTGRTSTRPEEVLVAAQQGRVDTLFLSTETWRPEVPGGPCLIHDEPSTSVDEQLVAAALATLSRGGTILTVPAVHMPDVATSGAAVFRY